MDKYIKKITELLKPTITIYDYIYEYMVILYFLHTNKHNIINNEIYQHFTTKYNSLSKINLDNYKLIQPIFAEYLEHSQNINHIKILINYLSTHKNKQFRQYYQELVQIKTSSEIINIIFEELKNYNIQYDKDKILNLFSGTGTIMDYLVRNKYSTNNLIGYDINDKLNAVNYLNLNIIAESKSESDSELQTYTDYKSNIHTFNLLNDDLPESIADLIICDLPLDIKNIIHAKCSNNIKQLKIRGTKSEPLIIQLITTLLANNGLAVVILSDSFLYNDSIQHIETRKYLINNFNIIKIINIPNIKKSIIFFNKTSPTTNITLINLKSNQEINLSISIDNLIAKQYSLYYYTYNNLYQQLLSTTNINNLKYYINILDQQQYQHQIKQEDLITNNALYIIKYNHLEINKISIIKNYDYIIITKNETIFKQEYLNYYLKYILEKNFDNLTKGKIKQYDINSILNLQLNIQSIDIQEQILNHINTNNNLLLLNNHQIKNLNLLKSNYIKSILNLNKTSNIFLNEICTIQHNTPNANTIQINRNSNYVGTISLTTEPSESTNYYYLYNINPKYNQMVIYYLLKENEEKLKKIANINTSNQLARNKLEKIEIPDLSTELQEKILQCSYFDNQIKQYEQSICIVKESNQQIFNLF